MRSSFSPIRPGRILRWAPVSLKLATTRLRSSTWRLRRAGCPSLWRLMLFSPKLTSIWAVPRMRSGNAQRPCPVGDRDQALRCCGRPSSRAFMLSLRSIWRGADISRLAIVQVRARSPSTSLRAGSSGLKPLRMTSRKRLPLTVSHYNVYHISRHLRMVCV